MSDQINPAPGAALPAIPSTVPAQAGPPETVAPVAPPVLAEPAAQPKKPRVLNPYAAKVNAPVVAEDPRIAALTASNQEHLAALNGFAQAELGAAPEALRNAVKAIAGDNPMAQLKAMATLKAHGLTGGTISPGATTGAAPKAAPKAAPVASPEDDILATYNDLRAKGANLLASQFRSQNSAAIAKAMASKSNN